MSGIRRLCVQYNIICLPFGGLNWIFNMSFCPKCVTIASLKFSSKILMVTIGTCEDTLTIVEEIGGTPALKNIENVCIVNNSVQMIRSQKRKVSSHFGSRKLKLEWTVMFFASGGSRSLNEHPTLIAWSPSRWTIGLNCTTIVAQTNGRVLRSIYLFL